MSVARQGVRLCNLGDLGVRTVLFSHAECAEDAKVLRADFYGARKQDGRGRRGLGGGLGTRVTHACPVKA